MNEKNSNYFDRLKQKLLRLLPYVLSAFVLFLLVNYWTTVTLFAGILISAIKPILIGFVIAYLLDILMAFYKERLFSKLPVNSESGSLYASLILAIITVLTVLGLVIQLVVPQLITCISTLVQKAPAAIENLLSNQYISTLMTEDFSQSLTDSLDNINWSGLVSKAETILRSGVSGSISQVKNGFSLIMNVVLGIIFALYFVLGKKTLLSQLQRFLKAYTRSQTYQRLSFLGNLLNTSFHNYIVGQCVEAVILGLLCIAGMLVLRLPYASMIGALVGITALIPVAGCYIGMGVGAVMIASVSISKALIFLIFLVILQQIEGNLIYPRVVGSSVGLSGIWVLSAVTVFGALFGIAGMLVGVPITSACYQLLRDSVKKREWASGATK